MLTGIEVNFSLIVNIIRTLIDLLLVWYILYLGISMFKQNMRTMQLFKGVLIILLIKLVTSVLGLSTMSYLVDTVLTWGIIAIIVIFQPEIRSLLEKMGQTKREYHMDHLSNDQKEHMLLGIFLLFRRRKKVIFGVIIDHGFCQNLVVVRALAGSKTGIHKCRDLIHVQINVGNVFRVNIVNITEFAYNVHDAFFIVLFHNVLHKNKWCLKLKL